MSDPRYVYVLVDIYHDELLAVTVYASEENARTAFNAVCEESEWRDGDRAGNHSGYTELVEEIVKP